MSGLDAKIMTGIETTYGTAATLDRAHEFVDESLELTINEGASESIRAGALGTRGSRYRHTTRTVGGSVNLEAETKGFGRWLKLLSGSTAEPVQQGATTAYLQTHTPQTALPSASVQVLRPKDNGVNKVFTYLGCKVLSWRFTIDQQGILKLALDFDGRDVDTSVVDGAVAYGAGIELLDYSQGTVKVDGVAIGNILSGDFGGANPLKTDRYHLGGAGLKSESRRSGDYPSADGTLQMDWSGDADTLRDLWVAKTPLELIFEFEGSVIESTYHNFLRATFPEVYLAGKDPTASGKDLLSLGIPWKSFLGDAGNPLYTLEYQSTDLAV